MKNLIYVAWETSHGYILFPVFTPMLKRVRKRGQQ